MALKACSLLSTQVSHFNFGRVYTIILLSKDPKNVCIFLLSGLHLEIITCWAEICLVTTEIYTDLTLGCRSIDFNHL